MNGTIGELLAAACRRFGQRPALVRGDQARTYSELLERGARLANALRGAGLAPGTPVAAGQAELRRLVTIGATGPGRGRIR